MKRARCNTGFVYLSRAGCGLEGAAFPDLPWQAGYWRLLTWPSVSRVSHRWIPMKGRRPGTAESIARICLSNETVLCDVGIQGSMRPEGERSCLKTHEHSGTRTELSGPCSWCQSGSSDSVPARVAQVVFMTIRIRPIPCNIRIHSTTKRLPSLRTYRAE